MAPAFGVRLNGHGANRLAVMAHLRQHLGLSLQEIKPVAEAVPIVLVSGATLKAAADLCAAFERLGAEVEVYISSTGHEQDLASS